MKKYIQITSYVAFLFAFLSTCEKRQDLAHRSDLGVKKYELVIPHGIHVLNNMSSVFNEAGKDSLVLMDGRTQQFILADLSHKKILKTIPYEKQGPDFVDAPVHDLAWRKDKLFILSTNFISVYNEEGQVLSRIGLKDLSELEPYFIMSFDFWDAHHLVLSTTPKASVYQGGSYPLSKDHSLFALINWENGKLEFLPIRSPQESLVYDSILGYYNDYAMHRGVVNNQKLTYQFSFSAGLYRWQKNTNERKMIEAKSKFSKFQRTPTRIIANSPKEMTDYRYLPKEPYYWKLMFDQSTGWFARIHGQVVKDGDETSYQNYLMIFDTLLNTLYDAPIKSDIVSGARTGVFTNGKVYLLKATPPTEDAYHFTVYDFNGGN